MNTYTQGSDNNMLSTIDKQTVLLIVYKIDRLGTDKDFEKRWEVQALADRVLKVTGFGECDGGSVSINSMEICCYVNNFARAKQFLELSLLGTPYSDYLEIVEENEAYFDRLRKEQRSAPRIHITEQEIERALHREAKKQKELKR